MVTAALLASQLWLAHGGMAGATERDDFDPRLQRDLVGLDDVDFDSGWVPADSPVQLRFYAHVADSVVVEMLGDGVYDWDAEEIAFFGDEGGGHFSIDVGMNLQASVRFDVAGITWESDILGPWDYAITSDAYFTPYLLPGHPERPVVIEDQTDAAPVASVPIVPDIVLVSGNLETPVIGSTFDADEGSYAPIEGAEDSRRVAPFNQLDIRIERTWDYESWNLAAFVDLQNIYNALNPEATRYDYRYQESAPLPGLTVLPSLGVRGSF